MKKLITAVFCLVFAFALRAQDSSTRITSVRYTASSTVSKPVRFGFIAQPLLVSWMKPDTKNLKSEGSKLGISGGIMGEFYFSEHYAFTTGLMISQLGGKVSYPRLKANNNPNGDSTFLNVEYNYSTRFVEIPLLLKLKTDEFGYKRVYGEFGTSLGFLWSAKADLNQNVFNANDVEGNSDRHVNADRKDFNSSTSSVDEDNIVALRIPILVGAGIEYALSENTTFVAGLRYNAAITNALRATRTTAFLSYGSITVGILF